ncbi:MAG TPA: DUF373 family protein [Thermoplasmata archaeon]|nr:DUF373 family protein [Thermoplasmata archaeon]
MKLLVLNVDRDDDLGRKAKVVSPVVGRENNIKAAEKLALVDPEDSDVNSLFAAVSLYDELKKEERDVEIATICGHISVGIKSDRVIAQQLEEVLDLTKADEVILVTDGAEDELILPIIQSRAKISSIRRVVIKQSKSAEDTYYRVLKILDDEKVKKQFVLPFALVLIVWSLFALLNMASAGFSAIILTLGAYLFIHAMRWEKRIALIWEDIKSGFMTGRVSLYTTSIAVLILIGTMLYAYNRATAIVSPPELQAWHFVIVFVKNIIWGVVGAGLLAAFGRVVDVRVREKNTPWRYWVLPFSLLSFGFIGTAIFGALDEMLYSNFSFDLFLRTPSFWVNLLLGILIAAVGAITYHYIKEIFLVEVEEITTETS